MKKKNPSSRKRNLITKRAEFSASHSYWNDALSSEENRKVFGKHCIEHGHNFVMDVTVEGDVDPRTGMIINLFDLKKIINEVLVEFDHKNLNKDNMNFGNIIPTPENIAAVLWERLDEKIKSKGVNCTLYNVRLYETSDLYVDYRRVQE